MKKETSARSCAFPSKSEDGKFQNHLTLDGVSSRALDRKNKHYLAEVSFFPSCQREKFKETSVKHGTHAEGRALTNCAIFVASYK